MRHLTLLFFIWLLVASCTTITEMPTVRETQTFDFTKYSKSGFWISPAEYNGKYEPVGIININIYPGYKKADEFIQKGMKLGKYVSYGNVLVEVIDTDNILEAIHNEAKSLGADAIMNFDVRRAPDRALPNGVTISGVNVSGFAIKRK